MKNTQPSLKLMITLITGSLLLMFICTELNAQNYPTLKNPNSAHSQKFESLRETINDLLTEKEKDLTRLELFVLDAEKNIEITRDELTDVDMELMHQKNVLKIIGEQFLISDQNRFHIGGRSYTRESMEFDVAHRLEQYRETQHRRDLKFEKKKSWENTVTNGRDTIYRIRKHLGKAKAMIDTQENRWENACSEMILCDALNTSGAKSGLLLNADSELGKILSSIEAEVSRLEVLVESNRPGPMELLQLELEKNQDTLTLEQIMKEESQ
ncbi:hypothetical protein K8T06_11870 [bacterium]|nr:hypothetical protein [bacterium]